MPEPGEGELLIRTRAAGVSTTDLAVMAGWMKDYFEHVFPLVPGIDVSGVVERVGSGVEGFAEGDEDLRLRPGRPSPWGGARSPSSTKIDTGAAQHQARLADPRAGGDHRPCRADGRGPRSMQSRSGSRATRLVLRGAGRSGTSLSLGSFATQCLAKPPRAPRHRGDPGRARTYATVARGVEGDLRATPTIATVEAGQGEEFPTGPMRSSTWSEIPLVGRWM